MNWNFFLIILIVLSLIGVILWISFKNSNATKNIPIMELNASFQENNPSPIVINYVSNNPIVTTVTTGNTTTTTTTNPPAPDPSNPGTSVVTPPRVGTAQGSIIFIGSTNSGVLNISRINSTGRTRNLKSINTGNVITGITVFDVPSLQEISFTDYAITEVTFQSNLPGLNILNLYNNGIENLDLTKVPNISNFDGNSNFFKTLNFSSNNNIQSINLSNNDSLSQINLNGATMLKNLILENVNTTSTGKVNITGITDLINLQNITASSLEPSQLNDLPVKSNIQYLNLNNTGYSNIDIDLSQYTGLISLSLESNNFSGIMDLSGLNSLQSVSLNNNSLSGLILPVTNNIDFLSFSSNNINSIDITSCINTLSSLYCGNSGTDISGLDQVTILDTLQVSFITPVDMNSFGNLSTLTNLDCSGSNFISNTLDLTNLSNLRQLAINNILNINLVGLSSLTNLSELQFSETYINPDLTVLISLTNLIGNDNNLSSLNLTNLSNLEGLAFYNNAISSIIGLSSCINIKVFSLSNNSLDSSSVDNILITINSFNTSGISIDLLNNSPRTSASDEAYNGLISRGWSVVVD
jgi:Leucine-rich repeat (LRR) protein